jgi:hypothetical protein
LEGVGRFIPRKEGGREGGAIAVVSVRKKERRGEREIAPPSFKVTHHSPSLPLSFVTHHYPSASFSFPQIRTCVDAGLAVRVPLAAVTDWLVHDQVADRTL